MMAQIRPHDSGEIAMLLASLDEAYERKAWHGPNLKGSIRGLSLEVVAWRPSPARHNIWEHVLHAAYWKYIVRRRLLREKRGSFPLKGSNWFTRSEDLTAAAWKSDVALLDQMHRALREAVAALDPRELAIRPAGSKVTNAALLRGIAAHDVYHAGQIQLLKRLAGE
jgi:uncharacterized damage-inducible protein DinB